MEQLPESSEYFEEKDKRSLLIKIGLFINNLKKIKDNHVDRKDIEEKNKSLKSLSESLKELIENLLNNILEDPSIEDNLKIKYIQIIFYKYLEEKIYYLFTEKVEEIFGEIFKNNILWKEIFKAIIYENNSTIENWESCSKENINKYIRFNFIQNYKNVDEIIELLENDLNIDFWFRWNIGILKRLDEKISDLIKNWEKITSENLYVKYYIKYKWLLENRNDINSKYVCTPKWNSREDNKVKNQIKSFYDFIELEKDFSVKWIVDFKVKRRVDFTKGEVKKVIK